MINLSDSIVLSENVSLVLVLSGTLSQDVALTANTSYSLVYRVNVVGSATVQLGTDYYNTVTDEDTEVTTTIVHGAGTGNYTLSFNALVGFTSLFVDSVSLKEVVTPAVVANNSIKEFLTGNTDEELEIVFRADTQTLQLQEDPEMYSRPVTILSETERGSMMKVFVSLNDKTFYELEGTTIKGISNLKVGLEPEVDADMSQNADNIMAQSIKVSYRDASKQRSRILQLGILTIPTAIDHSP